ncbi:MAG TPA: hypothetical protein DDY14_17425 [Chromatiaceae bacterium]|nr:hypothetical protein [Chromatiaceae bacterium]
MTSFRTFCIALLLLALTTPAAFAQTPADHSRMGVLPRYLVAFPGADMAGMPGMLRPGSDAFSLLTLTEVQQDLALSEGQINRLRQSNPLFRNGVTRAQPGSEPSGESDSAANLEQLLWTSRGAIANVLNAQQIERLQQIMVQQGGPCAIPNEPDLLRRLQIGETQKDDIAAACDALMTELRAAFQAPPRGQDPCPTLRANEARLEPMRQTGEAAIVATLSAQQRRTLQQLTGAKLSIAFRAIPECAADPVQMQQAVMREEP